jgi:hypothetical protein
VAHPFLPMTNELLKKLSQVSQDSILTAEFSEPRFVFEIPKIIPTEELSPQNSETNHSQLPH